jgi:hypothetical protein
MRFLQRSLSEPEADGQAGVRKLSECEAVLPSPANCRLPAKTKMTPEKVAFDQYLIITLSFV